MNLSCSFGTDWHNHAGCSGCKANSDRLALLFEADVKAGKYDAFGYSKLEAKSRRPTQLPLELTSSPA